MFKPHNRPPSEVLGIFITKVHANLVFQAYLIFEVFSKGNVWKCWQLPISFSFGAKKQNNLGTRKHGNGNVQAKVRANNSGQFEGTTHKIVGFRGKKGPESSPELRPEHYHTFFISMLFFFPEINRKHINIFLTALVGQSSQGRIPTRPRDKRDKIAILLWN